MDVRLPDGTVISNVPDEMSKADLTEKLGRNGYDVSKLSAPSTPSVPFGQRLNAEISNIPRQIGLTARHGLTGVGNLVGMFSDPIAALMNVGGAHMLTAGSVANNIADSIGLPTPANETERIVGKGTELLTPGAGVAKGSSVVANAVPGVAKKVFQSMAANPVQQTLSAGASGLAGQYVAETGGNDASQLTASLAAGILSPFAMSKAQQARDAAAKTFQRVKTPAPVQNPQIDIHIDNALQSSGMTMADLPINIQNGIRQDVQAALQSNGTLSPDAIRRLADYRLTNTTPTAATLTLDPAMVSQQKNLAKLGINSKDPSAQELGQVENANNRQLITGLNDLGANTPDTALAGGQKIIGALSARNDRAKELIGAQYSAARDTNGRSAPLDPFHFTNSANGLLDEAMLGGKLPTDVRTVLNRVAKGEIPLTVDVAEQFKTRIGDLQRATNDRSEKMALGLVRKALDDTPLIGGQAPAAVNGGFQLKTMGGLSNEIRPNLGQESIDAFNQARRLNRAWMGIVEKTPALQAVRDGIEPDKFVQQFIVGNGGKANLADLEALRRSVKSDPTAMTAVKEQIAAHLKKSALNGATDEVGNFSQSAYNKALSAIGEQKLGMFFTRDELNQLKAIGRVSSYEQFQPVGSAVNNSNTAGTALSALLDRVANSTLLSKIPFGSQLSQPAQNMSIGIRSNQAMNVPGALTSRLPQQRQPAGLLMSPAVLAMPEDERKRGLLSP